MTRLPVVFILALVAVGVGIFTSDTLTVIGCWVLVGAFLIIALRRIETARSRNV